MARTTMRLLDLAALPFATPPLPEPSEIGCAEGRGGATAPGRRQGAASALPAELSRENETLAAPGALPQSSLAGVLVRPPPPSGVCSSRGWPSAAEHGARSSPCAALSPVEEAQGSGLGELGLA
ncbi:unnamed protein product [Prorocentrum cordatum]|uniref:Uncharacterized protein n=1 Tax=Prorocentrum cordatum TaxID=2364126 RepID=A0ABN9W435_9DINO|nr:unnamed protein product [Polarella glacialis]